MPSGGKRAGAGRKFGSLNKRHQVTVKDIGHDGYLPIEYMLALMRDERTEASRRDAMAIQAAPYIHARLNAVATSNVNGNGGSGGDINIVQIIAVPRGGKLDPKTGMITTIDGAAVSDLPELRPYEPTPPLGLSDQTQPAPIEPPLPIPEVDTANVERLDAWRKRDDGSPDLPAGPDGNLSLQTVSPSTLNLAQTPAFVYRVSSDTPNTKAKRLWRASRWRRLLISGRPPRRTSAATRIARSGNGRRSRPLRRRTDMVWSIRSTSGCERCRPGDGACWIQGHACPHRRQWRAYHPRREP